MEGWPRGRWHHLGKMVRGNPPWVRIPLLPPNIGVSSNGRIAVSKIVNGSSNLSALAMSAECGGVEARACPEVLVEPLPKVCGVQIKRG